MSALLWIGASDVFSRAWERDRTVLYWSDLEPASSQNGVADFDVGKVVEEVQERTREAVDTVFIKATAANSERIPVGLDRVPQKTVAYLLEVVGGFPWMADYAAAVDHVLVPFKEYIPLVAGTTWTRPHWLGIPPDFAVEIFQYGHPVVPARCDPGGERPYDVAFVGTISAKTHPEREGFFRLLSERLGPGVRTHFGPGRAGEILPQTKMAINHGWRHRAFAALFGRQPPDYFGPRVFEAMGAGALLLNDMNPPSMLELFEPGKHFIPYEHNSVEEAARAIEFYLAHPEERLAMARAGWEEILRAHTTERRLETFRRVMQMDHTREPEDRPFGSRAFFLASALLKSVLLWTASPSPALLSARLAESKRLLLSIPKQSACCWAAQVLAPAADLPTTPWDRAAQPWINMFQSEDPRVRLYSAKFLSTVLMASGNEKRAVEMMQAAPVSALYTDHPLQPYLAGHLESLLCLVRVRLRIPR